MNRYTQPLVASTVALAACLFGTSTATAQLPEDGKKVLGYYVGTWEYEWEVEGDKKLPDLVFVFRRLADKK